MRCWRPPPRRRCCSEAAEPAHGSRCGACLSVARRWRNGIAFARGDRSSSSCSRSGRNAGSRHPGARTGGDPARSRSGDRGLGRPRPVPRLRPRPLAAADGLHARVLLQRTGCAVGSDRRPHRRAPRAARRDRVAPGGLARSVPRREGVLAARGHPGEQPASSCRRGRHTCSCSPRSRCSCRPWRTVSDTACGHRRRHPSRAAGSSSSRCSPWSCRPRRWRSLAARGAFPRTDPGRRRQLHPHPVDESVELRVERGRRQPAHMGRRTVARASSTACTAGGRTTSSARTRTDIPLSPATSSARCSRACASASSRRGRPSRHDVSHRRRDELGRRPGVRGRLRVQSAGGCGRLSFSSSSAIRCARSTFSSVSREITVE